MGRAVKLWILTNLTGYILFTLTLCTQGSDDGVIEVFFSSVCIGLIVGSVSLILTSHSILWLAIADKAMKSASLLAPVCLRYAPGKRCE